MDHTCLAVISLDSANKKDEYYYPQVFLKECKYIKKKLVRNIIDDLKSSSNDCGGSDDSDKESIKAIRLTFFESVLFEKVILKICIFEGEILKISYMREQFQTCFLQEQFWKSIS